MDLRLINMDKLRQDSKQLHYAKWQSQTYLSYALVSNSTNFGEF